MKPAPVFSITEYATTALRKAEYHRDENGMIVGKVPGASGFFAQGDTFEEARVNLRDVIKGNVVLALHLGLPIPEIESVQMTEQAHA
jgi:predicted RNase H-like HicB family nuclease